MLNNSGGSRWLSRLLESNASFGLRASYVSYCTSIKGMADAQEVLDSEGGCPEKQEWTQGRVSVVLEKQVQSPKEWQKHNQWEGTANNWGVATTEDISDGAWPDTLASYILRVVGPAEFNCLWRKMHFKSPKVTLQELYIKAVKQNWLTFILVYSQFYHRNSSLMGGKTH